MRTIGNGKGVEALMKDILVEIRLLGINQQRKELEKEITELADLLPSVSDEAIDGLRFSVNGPQFSAKVKKDQTTTNIEKTNELRQKLLDHLELLRLVMLLHRIFVYGLIVVG